MTIKKLLTFLFAFLPLLFLLIDSFGSNKTILTYLGISSSTIMVLGWSALLVSYTAKDRSLVEKKYWQPTLLLLVLISLLTTFLTIWSYVSPANHVFSITRLHPEQLGIICLHLCVVLLLTRPINWLKKHAEKIILITPFLTLYFLMIARLWPFDYFMQLVKEDRIIENLQFFVLFFGSLITLKNSLKIKKYSLKFFVSIFAALILFFIAGEEISWGQRIFNIQTPTELSKINLQNETTLHNINTVQWIVEISYALIGILGGILWLLPQKYFKKYQHLELLIPKWYLFGFFIFSGIYYCYPLYSGINLFRSWAEIFELLLHVGIVGHVLNISKAHS